MLRFALLHLSELESPRKLLAAHPWGRRLVKRFIAGEELNDAIRAVRRLTAAGFSVTLDHLGESVTDAPEAEQAGWAHLAILDRLATENLPSHISIKLTQLGLAADAALARRLVEAICARALRYGSFVRIDMEGSAHTEKTLHLFREVQAPRDVLGVVIQAYLYRSERDIDELVASGVRVRLCKGAYREPPALAFPRKADVDRNYARLMEKLLRDGEYPALATHDSRLIAAARKLAAELGLGPDRFEFQMLYGVRRQLQRQLLDQGYRVRLYVPYGKQWYPYFMRRLAERPSNLFFLLRNLLRA